MCFASDRVNANCGELDSWIHSETRGEFLSTNKKHESPPNLAEKEIPHLILHISVLRRIAFYRLHYHIGKICAEEVHCWCLKKMVKSRNAWVPFCVNSVERRA